MAESTDPLREQVARLLANVAVDSGDPDVPEMPLGFALGDVLVSHIADTLLPLFVARERAAAEKALLSMADRLERAEDTSWDTAGDDSGYEYKSWSEGSGVRAIYASHPEDFIREAIKRDATTVRAQLEGDGA